MSFSLEGASAALSTVGSKLSTGATYVGNGIYSGAAWTGNSIVAVGKTIGNGFVYAGSTSKAYAGYAFSHIKPAGIAAASWATGPGAALTCSLGAVAAFVITEFPSLQPHVNTEGDVVDHHRNARLAVKAIAFGAAFTAGIIFAVGPQGALALASAKSASVYAAVKALPLVGVIL